MALSQDYSSSNLRGGTIAVYFFRIFKKACLFVWFIYFGWSFYQNPYKEKRAKDFRKTKQIYRKTILKLVLQGVASTF